MDDEEFQEGLARFYSSQADLMLAQYENINQLLGPTTDWTHPGSHCEILIRDFIRRNLLHGMSADKGFIYGRVSHDGKDYHGPEIDILIHDTLDYRPVFRLEDFVIVQPEAVLGIIQIKRTFRSGKEGSLAVGIRQAVEARQHLLDVLVQAKVKSMAHAYGGDASRAKMCPEIPELFRRVFSAVVSFDDESASSPETYKEHLAGAYRQNQCHSYEGCPEDSAIFALPDFVGSLKHMCLASFRRSTFVREYYAYDSLHGGKNFGVQILLNAMACAIFDQKQRPPLSFPKDYGPQKTVMIG
jgi:hypothetical protein